MPVPAYDRDQVQVGIVHVGVGGVHRPHQAVYADRLLAAGHLAWGVCGIDTRPGDRAVRDVLRPQNGLYTVLVEHPDGTLAPQVVGALTEYLYAPTGCTCRTLLDSGSRCRTCAPA